jgi:hypothetical protein
MARIQQYTTLLTDRKSSVLPEQLQQLVQELSERLVRNEPIVAEARRFSEMTAAVLPAAIASAAAEIPLLGRFYYRHPISRRFWRSVSPIGIEREALDTTPSLTWLYIFHGDGRLREAALHRIGDPPPNAFLFAALAYRLNDWAEPVRIAAEACARRVFPRTAPSIIAGAALHLLTQKQHWKRWGAEAAALDVALFRPDVIDQLASIFRAEAAGALSSAMRQALRSPHIDRHLPDLLDKAAQPAVRAIALQSLVEKRGTWPVGFRQEWIDKSLGRSRRIPAFEERPIEHSIPLAALVSTGATDRSVAVRKLAADALIKHADALAGLQETTGRLLRDPSRAVRERMDFYLRRSRGEVAWTSAPAGKAP